MTSLYYPIKIFCKQQIIMLLTHRYKYFYLVFKCYSIDQEITVTKPIEYICGNKI